MTRFSSKDIDQLDEVWRNLPRDHAWTGWARTESRPDEVWVFRTRANWRRFVILKDEAGFLLRDDSGDFSKRFDQLAALPDAVSSVPSMSPH